MSPLACEVEPHSDGTALDTSSTTVDTSSTTVDTSSTTVDTSDMTTETGDEDTRLFDETGVWAVEHYSLDGGPFLEIAHSRRNRFLLRFVPDDGVVAAAVCHEQGTEVDIKSSNCINAALATWTCQCFAYTFDGDRMVWQEFAGGTIPPPVGVPGDGSTAHELFVAKGVDLSSSYEFNPLPAGLFSSDGEISRHVLQRKLDAVWTAQDVNGDGAADLQGCSLSCFSSGN
ncbi:MAG: hypothetical protein R6X02_23870 [Enhygromyxa sp.]